MQISPLKESRYVDCLFAETPLAPIETKRGCKGGIVCSIQGVHNAVLVALAGLSKRLCARSSSAKRLEPLPYEIQYKPFRVGSFWISSGCIAHCSHEAVPR